MTHLPTGISVVVQAERSQLQNRIKAMEILQARIYHQKKEAMDTERSQHRNSLIGTAMRSEKIRTYNFPQSRVSDHRISLTLHNLDDFLAGGPSLDEMIAALRLENEAKAWSMLENDNIC
jgi:peptide chain release factor 1